jgi:thiol-disulfide isomerase/thioredoxin
MKNFSIGYCPGYLPVLPDVSKAFNFDKSFSAFDTTT